MALTARGKSGLHRTGRQVTPGRREPAGSATESRPPGVAADNGWRRRPVRVKGCGKSAPRDLATVSARHPRPEQGQIGVRWRCPRRARVGRKRRPATVALDEWLLATEPGLSTGSLFQYLSGTNRVRWRRTGQPPRSPLRYRGLLERVAAERRCALQVGGSCQTKPRDSSFGCRRICIAALAKRRSAIGAA